MKATEGTKLMTIQELANATGTNQNFWYQRSRRGLIPGQRRIGRFLRIDSDVFYEALQKGEIR